MNPVNPVTAVLAALADPTRRHVLEMLRARPRGVGEIAAALPVSQPAVSQHLRVLLEAGLVEVERHGRRRIYRLRREGLSVLRAWTDAMWEDALGRFAASFEDGGAPDPKEEDA